jgi:hypothetical protein
VGRRRAQPRPAEPHSCGETADRETKEVINVILAPDVVHIHYLNDLIRTQRWDEHPEVIYV